MREASHKAKAGYAYCQLVVRRDDPDRWLASLFIPKNVRPQIHALLAFSLEIARVREIVSEPLLGEIRFQWWRDAIEAPDRADVAANPVAVALLDTISRCGLPTTPLLELIDARLFDLYDEPMQSVAALEAYAKATQSSLFRLSARILDPQNAVDGLGIADHAGIAYALTGLLRALPWHSARGQAFIPLEILRKHGAECSDLVAGRATPEVAATLSEMRSLIRAHLETFHARLPTLHVESRAAYLAVALCEPYLRQMEKSSLDPFKAVVELPQWRRQWILWRTARRWG